MRIVSRSIELPDGLRLRYLEHGRADGVPVVLLHGITDSEVSFEPLLGRLPPAIRALALTQRGHGESDRPSAGYRTRDFAADVVAFVQALRLPPVVLVGHSMGATNAMRVAIDRPDLVRGLVLIGAFASYRASEAVVDFFRTEIEPLPDPVPPALARAFQESTLARPIDPAFLDRMVGESLKVPAPVWREAFAALFDDDVLPELGRIVAPTRLVWGARDAFATRRDQDRLFAALRKASLAEYSEAGHAVHWEQPDRVAAELRTFVEGLARAAA